MATLYPPSYQRATWSSWIELAAPYIDSRDYPALCRVSRYFWKVFAPLLWENVLRIARTCSVPLIDGEVQDRLWWESFVRHTLSCASPATRRLSRIFDVGEYSDEGSETSSSAPFTSFVVEALKLLDNVACIFLDQAYDIDVVRVIRNMQPPNTRLRFLSMRSCPVEIPSHFWKSAPLRSLIYLDISGTRGSLAFLHNPASLPRLRVLKIRERELSNSFVSHLCMHWGHRLWSLDVACNKLTDNISDKLLLARNHDMSRLRSAGHVASEGRLTEIDLDKFTKAYGRFQHVIDSDLSSTFKHPERYLGDAPVYKAGDMSDGVRRPIRQDGISNIRRDSADEMARKLSDSSYDQAWEEQCEPVYGITHLDVSHNRITSAGVEKILRDTGGMLESFSCDSAFLVSSSISRRFWPKMGTLHGLLGAAYALRPIISANLRKLSLHHSIVTQIPRLEVEGLHPLSLLYLAETSVLRRSEMAYPRGFVPDMNPRVTSLTLTEIPRRSSGPLITKLCNFLRLLSAQECAIQEVREKVSTRWGPPILKGLRHLRLEFARAPPTPLASYDYTARELMETAEQPFSFFDGENGTPSTAVLSESQVPVSLLPNRREDLANAEYVNYTCTDGANPCTVSVWIGPPQSQPNPVISTYRNFVVNSDLQDGVGPVSPEQALAGAPADAYIFHTAWRLAIMPPELRHPSREDLSDLKDVLLEIKRFRQMSKSRYLTMSARGEVMAADDPLLFWSGNLQVST